jgi:hypothetical protein
MADLKKIEDKIDKIIEVNNTQNIHLERLAQQLERNTDSLIIHEKRTQINQERLDNFEDKFMLHLNKFDGHISFVKGAVWVLGVLFAITQILIRFR